MSTILATTSATTGDVTTAHHSPADGASPTAMRPDGRARRIGLAYVGIVVTGIVAEFALRQPLIHDGDAVRTAASIAAHPGRLQASIGADVVMIALDVSVAVGSFRLLRATSPRLAAVAAGLRLAQAAVLVANLGNLGAALRHAEAAIALAPGTDHAAAQAALDAVERHAVGYDLGLVPFGLACVALAPLLARSGWASRRLAGALAATGAVYVIGSSVALGAPSAAGVVAPLYLLPMVVEPAVAVRLVRGRLAPGRLVPGRRVPAATQPTAIPSAPAERDHGAGDMVAVLADRYGPVSGLRFGSAPIPRPGPTEVLVRVAGAGVDRGVWHLATGLPYPTRLAFGLRRPRRPIPGLDLSGTVVAVGESVTRFVEGDTVFGHATGSYAAFAVASQEALAIAPAGLDLVDAAALATSGSTALQALEDRGRVRAGQRVLVLGASGGVGSFAVQIARAAGARVTGTASTAKVDVVRSLGVDEVIDHRRSDPLATPGRYDLIVDAGGNRALRHLRRALTPTGTLVIVGGENGGRRLGGLDRQLRALVWSRFSRRRLTTFVAAEDVPHLERLADLVEEGHAVPAIDGRYPLHRAPEALQRLEDGLVSGKLVVDVAAGPPSDHHRS